ncbi:hypothetical protein AK830_g12311 [Neonectria ditissima]|uniref:Uncharacterized protein n=1 Tax=Neonectria ditissima TaxID=78410 RepID=A0A0P7B5Q5_9HYPO|nr:hypothetical protein AK830_g12311 [Neonectria ditissima]
MDLSLLSDQERDLLITKWYLYGQRGRKPSHRVAPWHWKNHPFVKPVSSSWPVLLNPDQVADLQLGFLPERTRNLLPPLQHAVPDENVISHSLVLLLLELQHPLCVTEDRWFIYAEGPNHRGEVRVHMHESMSGFKQIELVIDAGFQGCGASGEVASIRDIVWETDPCRGLGGMDVVTSKMVAAEVCRRVMGVFLATPDVFLACERLLGSLFY